MKRTTNNLDIAIKDLAVLRKTIEDLDEQILVSLNKRGKVAAKIGKIKKASGLPLVDRKRESAVIAHAVSSNKGPFCDKAVKNIFRQIMKESVFIQKR